MNGLGRALTWSYDRPRFAALVLGAVAALGFQPLGLWPITLVSIGALALLIDRTAGWKAAAQAGWMFGLGHFTVGNWWIATAFTYQAQMPAVLGWAAVPLLALYLALYPALAAAGARALQRHVSLPLGLAGLWIVTEWLRGWVFTGYPWNPLGVVLLGPFDRPGLAAALPWMGTYALSGFAVLIGCGIALALRGGRWLRAAPAGIILVVGMHLPVGERAEGSKRFTLVQPDVRQEELNDPRTWEATFQRTAALSRAATPGQERLVLWPESGVQDYLQDGYPARYYAGSTAFGSPVLARRRIGQVIGDGSTLLTGAVDLEIVNGQAVGARNAVTAIDDAGRIAASYYKAHLVPYGEYLALRWLLEPLGATRLVPGSLDFLPGPGPRTLGLGGHGRIGVQICYEIIFSGEVVDPANRPDFIFNPSNDGWFGPSGPPQHLAQARLRAAEEGLPVLRATTTGISAVIDADGVVREHIGRLREGRIDGFVPPAHSPTLFARFGNWLALFWAALFLFAGLVVLRGRSR